MNAGVIQRPTEGGTSRRRLSAARAWLKAIELTARIETDPNHLFADVLEVWAKRQPERLALISQSESLTYGSLAGRINQYARWAQREGIGLGQTVCLMMPSRPEYVACWLGISRVGGVVALINTKLVGQSLAHCINVARAEHVILAAEYRDVFAGARPHLDRAPTIWRSGVAENGADLDAALAEMDTSPLLVTERAKVTVDDRALLIYTSGTTGLPKAANISHRRVLNWGGWFAGLMDASIDDRLYDCLPVYHSVGGVVAPCSMLSAGGSVVLVGKFSAKTFWDDIVRLECTMFQYIGELCRYLLKAPSCEAETKHRLRLACGNGLRGDIWQAFAARFAIPQILEFYAMTEGNFSLFNVDGKPGAIGRIPPVLAHRFPVAIVKVDAHSGSPVRDAAGLCIACARGDAGEAIGRIGIADEGGGRFDGYTDPAESEKKILRDVFAKGDAWFRTGDLMMLDKQGYFHFVDRVGDTFRWKGENVATSEVNDAIRDCPGVLDASTYGVAVPGVDGRAGMAAIVVVDGFDCKAFAEHLSRRLPGYAIPVFVRLSKALDTTETFKQKKQQLIREGFDPSIVTDPLLLRDPASGDYCPIDRSLHARIVGGAIRL